MGPRLQWRLRSKTLDLTTGVLMGVVNVTPDSFSDGGLRLDPRTAIAAGLEMASQGASIVDVGGESTRPGAAAVSVDEELNRVLPVVAGLAAEGVVVSIDTSKAPVAAAAIDAGAEIINDVTAASDPEMTSVMSQANAGVVLMHMQGTPRTMHEDPRYGDVVEEVSEYLVNRAATLVEAGIDGERIAIDPGIGFGKNVAHNIALIGGLRHITSLGYPVVLGASRKSFLGVLTGIEEPFDRDGATAITTALGFERGARIFRVHEVPGSRVALSVATAIVAAQQWDEWSQD